MHGDDKKQEELRQARAVIGTRGFRASRATTLDESIGRQRVDKDPFDEVYESFKNILAPPVRFDRLYSIYENSDILQACVAAMRKNVHGFGYELQFLGDDVTERRSPDALRQESLLKSFFNFSNEHESFQAIRDKAGEDYEVVGNAAIEVVRRPRTNEVAMCYYMPVADCRMCKLDEEPVKVKVTIPRNGTPTTFFVKKRFRRFVQVRSGMGEATLKWFKSFGDKRFLDATTGEYKKSASACAEVATELLWLRNSMGGRTYGYPRWLGAVTDILGRSQAQYVNYDLFEHQGIPPVLILVENGSLTDESRIELQSLIESMRGVGNFNKMGLIEAVPEIAGLDNNSNVKIHIKNMIENRNQDLLFSGYLKGSSDTIRQAFRLPALYLGSISVYSYAASFTARSIAEEQVFNPERSVWDEIINRAFVWESFGCDKWCYSSKGPQLAGAPDIINAMKEFGNMGAVSVNNAIEILNSLLGTQISKYDGEWAEQPFVLVKEMVTQNRINIPGGEDYIEVAPETPDLIETKEKIDAESK